MKTIAILSLFAALVIGYFAGRLRYKIANKPEDQGTDGGTDVTAQAGGGSGKIIKK